MLVCREVPGYNKSYRLGVEKAGNFRIREEMTR